MTITKARAETSGSDREGSRQAVRDNAGAGARIKEALEGREVSWLVRETGYGDSTIRDAIRRGPVRSDVAVAIAKALNRSVEWLLVGTPQTARTSLVDVADADWIEVPTFDLRQLQDDEKGKSVRQTPFRRDWLNNELGTDTRLWITSLLGDYPAASLAAGDLIIARDIEAGELIDRQLCLWREIESGLIFVARFAAFSSERTYVDPNGEQWIGRAAIAPRDNPPEVVPVGRIMGRPIAFVR